MNMAYLGFWSDVVSYVMDRILEPLFKKIGELLNMAFSWLFKEILKPVLEAVLVPVAKEIAKLIFELLAGVLYGLMATLWRFLDAMEKAYEIFIGISKVTITDVNNKASAPMSLLEALYSISAIRYAFWYVFVISLVMLFMFTMYAVAKSMFDLETERPHTVSHVMNSFLKACVQFLIVPLFVLFMIRFSGTLVVSLDNALKSSGSNGNATVGSTLFVVSSLNASKQAPYNISTATDDMKTKLGGVQDAARYPYYQNGKGTGPNASQKTYWNTAQVKQDFKFEKFDFIVGIGVSVFMFIVMVSCSIVFIQRLFDMLLLYIVSPFFVSTMPLDDGERFKRWRELFLGKSVSGLGSIVAMKLYLMIVPIIIGGQISFTTLSGESPETTYMLKVLFLLGGAWAATKSGSMITSLISSGAGSSEGQASEMGFRVAKYAYNKSKSISLGTASMAVGAAGLAFGSRRVPGGAAAGGGAASGGGGASSGGGGSASGGGEASSGSDGAFSGGAGDSGVIPGLSGVDAAGNSIVAPSEPKAPPIPPAPPLPVAGAIPGIGGVGGAGAPAGGGAGGIGAPAVGGAGGTGAPAVGSAGGAGGAGAPAVGNAGGTGAPAAGGAGAIPKAPPLPEGPTTKSMRKLTYTNPAPKITPMSKRKMANIRASLEKAQLPPQKTKRMGGLTFKTGADGKYHWNINMGRLFTNSYGADGSHTVKLLGLQFRYNHRGKLEKGTFLGVGVTKDNMGKRHFDIGFGKLIKRHVAADGSKQLSIGNGLISRSYDSEKQLMNKRTFGVEKQRNSKTGEMYTRRNAWSGLEKVQDKDGNVHTKSSWGRHYEPDGNGNYHFSHGWGYSKKTMVNEHGEAETVSKSFLGINFYNLSSKQERLSKLEVNKPKTDGSENNNNNNNNNSNA